MLITLLVFTACALISACASLALAWFLRGHVSALLVMVILSLLVPVLSFAVPFDWGTFGVLCFLAVVCVVFAFLGFIAAAFIDRRRPLARRRIDV